MWEMDWAVVGRGSKAQPRPRPDFLDDEVESARSARSNHRRSAANRVEATEKIVFGEFVRTVYYPFFKRNGKLQRR